MSDEMEFVEIWRSDSGLWHEQKDALAVEEPVELRVESQGHAQSLSITMRTPGHDFELATGFLFTEGLIKSKKDIESIRHCGPLSNIVRIKLSDQTEWDWQKFQRHFYMSSSCGICGKSSIEAVRQEGLEKNRSRINMTTPTLQSLPQRLREAQKNFSQTGGLHASAIFNTEGELKLLREDVGRHNALDKVIGAGLNLEMNFNDKVLLLSGRASFELIQKAVLARIPMVAAIGAPSSLAVALAKEFNITLVGFLRENRFNIYSGGRFEDH